MSMIQIKWFEFISLATFLLVFGGCTKKTEAGVDKDGFTAPSYFTVKKNTARQKTEEWVNSQDYLDANKGLVAQEPQVKVLHKKSGKTIWDNTVYSFISGKAPGSVQPQLWKQEQLNNIHGLFKVTEGIYQVRGYDISNLTLIEGQNGWIIVDPLTTVETAKKAIEFAFQNLGKKPITAIIFTHSHIDHFGGVSGLDLNYFNNTNGIKIIAPKGFMEEATSENIIAGVGMWRRSLYMFGERLPRSERGHIGSGLGKNPSFGTYSIRQPTDVIVQTGQELEIDGVDFIFQLASGAEAPAELTFYLPGKKAFCGAEILARTHHNLYTLRGAKVRDALLWSNYIDEAIRSFNSAEVYFGSHHWPIWGKEKIHSFLKVQRDTYKYIHDQTIRLANRGKTPNEIAELITLPESLRNPFYNRGYYGNVKQNTKAVYQYYFGWFDGNPAHLNPIPPVESSNKYVEFMGGEDAVLTKAQESFEKGEYRWVAEVLNHLVFAEPKNKKAKQLLAKTYDQLGYQAESGPWRDNYLTGAFELRNGSPSHGFEIADMYEILRNTPPTQLFNSMAVRLNGPKAEGKQYCLNIYFTDKATNYVLTLENAVLHNREAELQLTADATLRITHELFLRMLTKEAGIKDTLFSDNLEVDGSILDLVQFFRLFDNPSGIFNLVTP